MEETFFSQLVQVIIDLLWKALFSFIFSAIFGIDPQS